MFWVYVIYNEDAKISYTGQTIDLHVRIQQHNNLEFKGFTSRFRGEWKLIYSESVSTRSEALKREKQLKSGNGRAYVKQFIPT
jgi:putative endonuclease